MMRRRPLRRAAVIGGVAAVAHNSGKRAGEAQAAQQQAPQQPQYAPEPPPAPDNGEDMVTQLENLKKLLDQGILTQAEFDAQKQKILASS